MDTVRDRLAELAEDAPTGGAPAAELWARGKRAHRLRATALVSMVLVVVIAGARLGVGLPDGTPGVFVGPGDAGGITLPIEYPAGEELPDLGVTPGPLAAVWLATREPYTLDDDPGLAPEAVGLVAETGTFGTLPIDLHPSAYEAPDAHFALSPDGRRIAYYTPTDGPSNEGFEPGWELVVRDLVTGDEYSPAFDFEIRAGATWVDAAQLVGHVAGGSDVDGWVWEPGTAPELVNPHPYLDRTAAAVDILQDDPPWSCRSPIIRHSAGGGNPSVLCDVVGVIGSDILLGHLKPGADANDLNKAVVALDISDGADFPFDDPALRRIVVNSGAPYPVTFATDLIAEALDADGGAS